MKFNIRQAQQNDIEKLVSLNLRFQYNPENLELLKLGFLIDAIITPPIFRNNFKK